MFGAVKIQALKAWFKDMSQTCVIILIVFSILFKYLVSFFFLPGCPKKSWRTSVWGLDALVTKIYHEVFFFFLSHFAQTPQDLVQIQWTCGISPCSKKPTITLFHPKFRVMNSSGMHTFPSFAPSIPSRKREKGPHQSQTK